jgi:uncharacterized protein
VLAMLLALTLALVRMRRAYVACACRSGGCVKHFIDKIGEAMIPSDQSSSNDNRDYNGKRAATVEQPDMQSAIAYALNRLDRELSPLYVYHSPAHTRNEVLPAVEYLSEREGVSGEPLLLLRTAAAYHDIGFIVNCREHETYSMWIAQETLPRFSYRPEQIDVIVRMICATRLPQTPQTVLERILVDADLDSLGRIDYLTRSQDLRIERTAYGIQMTSLEWYRYQLRFLCEHRYFTAAARARRDAGKRSNIDMVRSMLTAAQVGSAYRQVGASL